MGCLQERGRTRFEATEEGDIQNRQTRQGRASERQGTFEPPRLMPLAIGFPFRERCRFTQDIGDFLVGRTEKHLCLGRPSS